MGKRTRPEGTASEYPIVTRRGWLHLPDGDVMEARELLGSLIQKLTPYDREWEFGGWEGVWPREVERIEWNEPEESGEPPGFVLTDWFAYGPV